ncbi:MAG TPA: DUF2157 domain-containing protein [Thermoanaerobaculia bacterium]|nr:DUF2157 domain-containing protein [Thermoanaerobaculia bacterium]
MLESVHVRWLREQLPRLVEAGVIDDGAAERLAAHFGAEDRARGRRLVVLLFGTLGALLVGGGIILLLAHNWDELGRPVRTVLSLLPLVVAIALATWVLVRGRGEGWHEAVGALWTLAIGAAISLIAQTYHLPGDFSAFMLSWLLLALPIVYVLESTTAGLLWYLGLLAWVVPSDAWDRPLLFWALLAGAAPFLVHRWRRRAEAAGTEMLTWVFAVAVAWGGVAAFSRLEDLWGPLAVTVSLALWTAGAIAGARRWARPLRLVGALAGLGVACPLSYANGWRGIDHVNAHFRMDSLGIAETVLAAAMVAATVALLALAWRRRGADLLPVAAALPVVWAAWPLAYGSGTDAAAALVNGYLLLLGAVLLVQGMREDRLRRANVGTAIVGLLILLRFFDTDWGFLVRGSAFVAVGLAFLLVNSVLLRRRGEA